MNSSSGGDFSLTLCTLTFWVVCGLIAGYIYKKKGRSQGIGCIAGFLLGPIGIILALVSSTDQTGLAKQANAKDEELVKRGALKKCPYCAELIKPEATVCRHCGRSLVAQAPVFDEVVTPLSKTCPKCGLPMAIKTATAGEHQGKQFYVCPNYKQCQQVLPL